ncbi:PREDICTED: mitochondrial import receptor subunit TOM40 homolog 1-like [Wasmannia auropunctata]|uniref:mitochondrial import receptor subunit TOM40 homolog 1-like n=1 Tax=Wasmannia auropunctata TaxID=64793 RepID=UPI0005F00005|nr:PREDICTED: mitochondrial import receptor subunit TOM40 homolog 1-like [Wasmannia auropunctata]
MTPVNLDEPPCVPCFEDVDWKPGNPSSFEDLHAKTKDLYPQNFEGAYLLLRKVLSRHFNVTYKLTLSSVTPYGLKFGVNYVGSKRVGLVERYPVISGEITPAGNMSAGFMHTFGCRYRFKFATQIVGKRYKAFSSGLEYRSDDCTVALTLANPDPARLHGTVVLHYLQAITPRITLGTEIACLRGSLIPGGQQTVMCAAFRHSTGPSTLSATFGEAGIHVCYHRQASEQLQLGVEIETNTRIQESVGTIVYRLDIPYADFVCRGFVNSETSIGAVFEKMLHPIPGASLVISGFLNHKKQQFRVGVGLNIG